MLAALLLTPGGASMAAAQDTAAARSTPPSTLRVFLDCGEAQFFGCDFDYARTEITFVDWVRERQEAQVHVLVTVQRTGSGGNEFALTFIGQMAFAGKQDTLKFNTLPAQADDATRKALVQTLKLGLVRYLAATPAGARLQISSAPADSTGAGLQTAPKKDRWNSWVYRTRANAFLNGENLSKSLSAFGSASANRTTEAWKINLSLNGNYDESRFYYGAKVVSRQRGYGLEGLTVKSLGDHWSAGLSADASRSDYSNMKLHLSVAPAAEYDFFPYAQSTRRQLTVLYRFGFHSYQYLDSTFNDVLDETHMKESLTLGYSTKQPWGSITTSLDGSHFFYDVNQNSVNLFTNLSVRLFRGFSLDLSGNVARVHDQISLSKRNLTPDEVLLRRRELATNYRYFAFVGLSYTFGSILNNVVNPRFEGGSGTFFMSN